MKNDLLFELRSTGLVRKDGAMPYWASTKDCRACALKPRCTKGAKRIVTRYLFEVEREHVRALKRTQVFEPVIAQPAEPRPTQASS
jgi:hypothetical protein